MEHRRRGAGDGGGDCDGEGDGNEDETDDGENEAKHHAERAFSEGGGDAQSGGEEGPAVVETRATRATGTHDIALVEWKLLLARRELFMVAEQFFLTLLDRVGWGIVGPSGCDRLGLGLGSGR